MLEAWKEFVRGKRKKRDVQEFQHTLMDNILALHRDLKAGTYKHGGYSHFRVSDPKPRDIHKASVRDRLLHHALYRQLYPFFDKTFIADSYSCRKGKGTHRAMNRFREFAYKVSRNHTRTCWVLKCDIRKCFASIDQTILLDIVRNYIPDTRTIALITEVVTSFSSDIPRFNLGMRCSTPPPIFYTTVDDMGAETQTHKSDLWVAKGLPLGNLTSQLLVNIYMNEFDQFAKHVLKAKHYVRYADDFTILSEDREWLVSIHRLTDVYLRECLKIELHPDKVFIKTFVSGVDFLGWVHFADHRVLRTSTKRRMLARTAGMESKSVLASYLGLLKHGNAASLAEPLLLKLKNLK